jgi:nuclear transport factor 2 (NTF2) superfamily protein
MPVHVLRELWVRTQNERAWRRFYILHDAVGELGFNRVEGYVNPHYDEEKWKTERRIILNPLEVLNKHHSNMPLAPSQSTPPSRESEN